MKKNNRSRIVILVAVLLAAAFYIGGCSAKNNGFFEQNKSLACWDSVSTNSEKLSETTEHNSLEKGHVNSSGDSTEQKPQIITLQEFQGITKTALFTNENTGTLKIVENDFGSRYIYERISTLVWEGLMNPLTESEEKIPTEILKQCQALEISDTLTVENHHIFYFRGSQDLWLDAAKTEQLAFHTRELLAWQEIDNPAVLYVAFQRYEDAPCEKWHIWRYDMLGYWFELCLQGGALAPQSVLTEKDSIALSIKVAGSPHSYQGHCAIDSMPLKHQNEISVMLALLDFVRPKSSSMDVLKTGQFSDWVNLSDYPDTYQEVGLQTEAPFTEICYSDADQEIVLRKNNRDGDCICLINNKNSRQCYTLPAMGTWFETEILLRYYAFYSAQAMLP